MDGVVSPQFGIRLGCTMFGESGVHRSGGPGRSRSAALSSPTVGQLSPTACWSACRIRWHSAAWVRRGPPAWAVGGTQACLRPSGLGVRHRRNGAGLSRAHIAVPGAADPAQPLQERVTATATHSQIPDRRAQECYPAGTGPPGAAGMSGFTNSCARQHCPAAGG